MRLSIILTVYNKECYLEKAFSALLNQARTSSDEYEIIAVNDGSTDHSAAILEDYSQSDNRVRILSQQNQGLSMARNNGVDLARGDYIWFVDSDDVVNTESVRLICDATKDNPDVISFFAQTEGIDHIRNAVNPDAKSGKDILLGGHWEQCGVFWVVRRGFLREYNLRFLPGVYHEDAEYTPRLLYYARTVKVIPVVLYTVIRAPGSITQVPRPKRAFDYLIISELLSRFVTDNGENNKPIGRSIDSYTAQYINNAFDIISRNTINDQILMNKEFYEKRKVLLRVLRDAPKWKYKIESVLFELFPKQYTRVYNVLKRF